jgi:hypothetical protein
MMAKGMTVRGKPVVLFQHGQDPRFGNEPIAKALKIEPGEHEGKTGILATTQFFDDRKLTIPTCTGERLYMKAKDDTMPNWSIGFNSTKSTPIKGGRRVDEWELHEYSQVAVGMNKEATTLAMKKYGDLLLEPKFVIVQAPEGFKDMEDFNTKTIELVVGEKSDDLNKYDKFRIGVDSKDTFGHNTVTHQWEKIDVKGGPGSGRYPAGSGKTQEALSATEHASKISENAVNNPTKETMEAASQAHEAASQAHEAAAKETNNPKIAEQHQTIARSHGTAAQAFKDGHHVSGAVHSAQADYESDRMNRNIPEKSFEGEIKSKKAPHELAHKNINALHKEMVDDLKAFSKDDVTERGTEGCAKEALEDFADSATHHVEKYIKCVREMEKGAELPSMEEKGGPGSGPHSSGGKEPLTNAEHAEHQAKIAAAQAEVNKINEQLQKEKDPSKIEELMHQVRGAAELRDSLIRQYTHESTRHTDPTKSFEEKDYSAPHHMLHTARNEMIKAIHCLTGDKSVVPSEAAKKIISDHDKAALPHAKEFIKAWHKEPETNPVIPEKKPVLKLKPQAQVKTLKIKPPTKPKVTAELVQQLIEKSMACTKEAITTELRRLSGKVT